MERVLVTGGCGFIGSNLVKRLVRDGYSVRVFDNHFRGHTKRLQDVAGDCELITGDIRDREAVKRACRGMEVIFHLACINGTRYFYEIPATVLEVAVKGTLHTLDAALRGDVRKYILASSSEIYHEPTVIPTPETERAVIPDVLNPRYSYAGGKLAGELLAVHYGSQGRFDSVIFRPHNIYGPDMGREHVIPEFILRMTNLAESNRGEPMDFPIQGSGRETRSFCYIDDLVDGLMLLLKSGTAGEIYHIGHDREEIAIGGLAEKIADLLRLKLNIIQTPLRPGGTSRRCPNIEKIRKLGYNPKVTLNDGLRRTLDWYVRSAEPTH